MRLRRRFVPLALVATAGLQACAPPQSAKPAEAPSASAPSNVEAPAAADSAPRAAATTASATSWPAIAASTLLDRHAPSEARAAAFAAFQSDAFERVAVIVRRADSKGADIVADV